MKVELVEFKRCCGCIPLRYGLLVMAYIKLIISGLLFLSLGIQTVIFMMYVINRPSGSYGIQLMFLILLNVVFLGEAVLSILFLVGGHKKSPKILRIYNNYAIGILVMFILILVMYTAVMMHYYVPRYGFFDTTIILRSVIVIGFANTCFQLYMILMTKSEITKLETNCNFEFSNIGVEAECTMVDGSRTVEEGNHKTNAQTIVTADPCEDLNETKGNAQEEKKHSGNYVKLV